jgi:SLT domain-containing protein
VPEWEAWYRAVGDFSDLLRKAAEAQAALAALQRTAAAEGQAEAEAAAKAALAHDLDAKAIDRQRDAMQSMLSISQNYNRMVNWGGASSPQDHLQYLERETNYQTLLNRARQRGFLSVQQDYAYRNQELAQRIVLNRAMQQGYATPEQYLQYLMAERRLQDSLNQSWAQQAVALDSVTAAALTHADALRGQRLSAAELAGESGLTALSQQLTALGGASATPDVEVTGAGQAISDIKAVEAEGAKLDGETFSAEADVDTAPALTAIAQLAAQFAAMKASLGDDVFTARGEAVMVPVKLSGGQDVQRDLDTIMARIEALKREVADPKVELDSGQFLAQLAVIRAALEGLRKYQVGDVSYAGVGAALTAFQELERLGSATFADLTLGAGRFGHAMDGANLSIAGVAGRWRALSRDVALFGGIATIGLWHIALDGIIEVLAILIPAAVTLAAALTAFGVAGYEAASQVYNRLVNVHTIAQATGKDLPPLTGALAALQDRVRPQVWELYGDAIDVVNQRSGIFQRLATGTGEVLDRMAARVTVAMERGSGGLQAFLNVGEHALAGLGQLASTIGGVALALIKVSEQTHIAEDLLAVVNVLAKLLTVVTSLPTPLLAVAIGLHGLYLWGGLALTGIAGLLGPLARLAGFAGGIEGTSTAVARLGDNASKLDRLKARISDIGTGFAALPGRITGAGKAADQAVAGIDDMGNAVVKVGEDTAKAGLLAGAWGTALTALKAIPVWGWVAAGVIAVGGLVLWLSRVKDATDKWVMSLDKMVSGSTIFNVLQSTSDALSRVNARIEEQRAEWDKLGSTSQLTTTTIHGQVNTWGALGQRLAQTNSGYAQVIANAQKASAVMGPAGAQLAHDTGVLEAEHAKLTSQLTLETTRLAGLANKYGVDLPGAMSLAVLAGVKVSDLISKSNVVWARALQQVEGLVQGYADMGQSAGLLGGDLNALTYAGSEQLKAIGQLNQAWDTFTKNVAGPATSFVSLAQAEQGFTKDAKGVHDAMTGLSASALTVQADFQKTYTQAETLLDALRTAGEPAHKFTAAVKEMVAGLLPMTRGNREAVAQVSALAQEAGGPATTNLKELQKWAGNTSDPMRALQRATNAAAIAASNLSADAAKLSTTLRDDLNKMMAVAILNTDGVQGAMQAYTSSLKINGAASQATQSARAALYNDLLRVTHNASEANGIIETLTATFTGNTQAMQAGGDARDLIVSDLKRAGTSAADANHALLVYSAAILANGKDSINAQDARTALINDLERAGVNSQTAHRLLDGFATSIDNMRKQADTSAGARQHLINDLYDMGTAAGLSRGKIISMISEITKIPKSKIFQILMEGKGQYTISQAAQSAVGSGTQRQFPRAEGGPVPGNGGPRADDQLIAASSGEYVMQVDAVRKYGLGFMDAINAQRLQAGGLVLGGNEAVLTGEYAVQVTDTFRHDIEDSMVSAMRKALKTAEEQFAVPAGGAATSEQVKTWILEALAIDGKPSSWLPAMEVLVSKESGGNPTIVNPTAVDGEHATGIAQMLPSTFASWALPGYGNILNPVDNLISSMRYITAEYGSPYNIPGLLGGDYQGYAEGGPVEAEDARRHRRRSPVGVFMEMLRRLQRRQEEEHHDEERLQHRSFRHEHLTHNERRRLGVIQREMRLRQEQADRDYQDLLAATTPGHELESIPDRLFTHLGSDISGLHRLVRSSSLLRHHAPHERHELLTALAREHWAERKARTAAAAIPGSSPIDGLNPIQRWNRLRAEAIKDQHEEERAYQRISHHDRRPTAHLLNQLARLRHHQREERRLVDHLENADPTTLHERDFAETERKLHEFRQHFQEGIHYRALRRRHPEAARNLALRLHELHSIAGREEDIWKAEWGPGGRLNKDRWAATPEPFDITFAPTVPQPQPVNVARQVTGGPAAPVFAVGGYVAPAVPTAAIPAGMAGSTPAYAGGGMVGEAAAPPPRQLSEAAAATGAGREYNFYGGINIQNPRAERASDSVARTVNKIAYLAGR